MTYSLFSFLLIAFDHFVSSHTRFHRNGIPYLTGDAVLFAPVTRDKLFFDAVAAFGLDFSPDHTFTAWCPGSN